ncbi:hypothetical protein ACFLYY_01765 [Patescibacteria group bacterium]
MIPLVSILNMVSALFFWGISLKLYFSYKKSKDLTTLYFLKSFIFLSLLLTFLAAPGLVLNNLTIIGITFNLHPIFSFLALAYLISVPLNLMGYNKTRKIIFNVFVIISLLFVLLSFLNWQTVPVFYEDQFIYWEDARGEMINVALGIIYGIGLLLVIIFFLIHGFKSSEKFVRTRSILISIGLLCIVFSTSVNYILGASAKIYITSIIANLAIIFAAIIIFAGIYYKSNEIS